jgi:hypothetical protein
MDSAPWSKIVSYVSSLLDLFSSAPYSKRLSLCTAEKLKSDVETFIDNCEDMIITTSGDNEPSSFLLFL